ncbi:MAG: hypothetical protein ACRCX2_04310 [Paraclostridium sp.]
MREKFSISFKNNDMEQAIKEYLNTKFNPTNYIKELVYNDMIGQGSMLVQQKTSSEKEIQKMIEDMKKQPLIISEPKTILLSEDKGEPCPVTEKEKVAAKVDKRSILAFDPIVKPF